MKKLLFAEDNADSRMIFEKLLKGAGYSIVTAPNGEVALKMIKADPPDMIVSDVMMPQIDGFELCRLVKADPALCKIPFVFYTATYVDPEDEKLGFGLGAVRYIVKPVEPAELIRQINEIFQAGEENGDCGDAVGEQPHSGALDRLQIDVLNKKLSKKVRELELFHQIFQLTHDAIAVTDPEGTYTEQNDAYCVLFSCIAEDLDHENIRLHLGDVVVDDVRRTLQAGERFHDECVCTLKTGHIATVEVSAFAINDELDSPIHHAYIVRDMTNARNMEEEKRKLQEQFLQAQKMESIGRLAGGVAHDFNNLLTSILGYAQLCTMNTEPDSPLLDYLQIISDSGERASNLTRQLLAFSRKQHLEMTVMNLNNVVDNMIKLLRTMVGEDVSIELHMQPTVRNIEADISQIEQVLMNLAVNARDAMPNGGRLLVETADVFVDWKTSERHGDIQPGQYVMLAVTDTGMGMPAEVREKIFEPFFTTKELGKGTGLGLSTVHGIVTQHNGHIYVYSEVGMGTTFKCYFKATELADEKEAEAVSFSMPGGQETILVVDDEASIRRLICDTLEPLGYKVICAANGEETLDLCENYPGAINLLISDIVMPGMNGRELSELLHLKGIVTKSVLTSGHPQSVLDQSDLGTSGTKFLQKPLSPSKLAVLVRSVLDNQ